MVRKKTATKLCLNIGRGKLNKRGKFLSWTNILGLSSKTVLVIKLKMVESSGGHKDEVARKLIQLPELVKVVAVSHHHPPPTNFPEELDQ